MFHFNKITLEVSSQLLLPKETTQLVCEILVVVVCFKVEKIWVVNENKLKCFTAITLQVHLGFGFLKWKCIFLFHIVEEEPPQHVQSDLAFASQNLKFAVQMSDDWH